jgi:hypothetical protein
MPDLAELIHEITRQVSKQTVYWGIDKKDKRVIGIVGRFLRIIHYGKTINQNLRDEYN